MTPSTFGISGLTSASDAVVLETARRESRIIVSADTDFAALLAHGHLQKPSVVLLRRQRDRHSSAQAQLLLDNLGAVANDLGAGAVVVLTDERIRVRRLPLLPE